MPRKKRAISPLYRTSVLDKDILPTSKRSLRHKKPIVYNFISCETCGAQFSDLPSLKEHSRIHKGAYLCPDCEATFNSKKCLRQHFDSEHGDFLFICEKCKWTTSNKTEPVKHFAENHPEAKLNLMEKKSSIKTFSPKLNFSLETKESNKRKIKIMNRNVELSADSLDEFTGFVENRKDNSPLTTNIQLIDNGFSSFAPSPSSSFAVESCETASTSLHITQKSSENIFYNSSSIDANVQQAPASEIVPSLPISQLLLPETQISSPTYVPSTSLSSFDSTCATNKFKLDLKWTCCDRTFDVYEYMRHFCDIHRNVDDVSPLFSQMRSAIDFVEWLSQQKSSKQTEPKSNALNRISSYNERSQPLPRTILQIQNLSQPQDNDSSDQLDQSSISIPAAVMSPESLSREKELQPPTPTPTQPTTPPPSSPPFPPSTPPQSSPPLALSPPLPPSTPPQSSPPSALSPPLPSSPPPPPSPPLTQSSPSSPPTTSTSQQILPPPPPPQQLSSLSTFSDNPVSTNLLTTIKLDPIESVIESISNEQASEAKKAISQYLCSQCMKCVFSCLSQVKQHIAREHPDDETVKPVKRFACPIELCNMFFRKKEDWKIHHMRKHLGLPLLNCEFCLREFLDLPTLQKHQLRHFERRGTTSDAERCINAETTSISSENSQTMNLESEKLNTTDINESAQTSTNVLQSVSPQQPQPQAQHQQINPILLHNQCDVHMESIQTLASVESTSVTYSAMLTNVSAPSLSTISYHAGEMSNLNNSKTIVSNLSNLQQAQQPEKMSSVPQSSQTNQQLTNNSKNYQQKIQPKISTSQSDIQCNSTFSEASISSFLRVQNLPTPEQAVSDCRLQQPYRAITPQELPPQPQPQQPQNQPQNNNIFSIRSYMIDQGNIRQYSVEQGSIRPNSNISRGPNLSLNPCVQPRFLSNGQPCGQAILPQPQQFQSQIFQLVHVLPNNLTNVSKNDNNRSQTNLVSIPDALPPFRFLSARRSYPQ